MSELRNDLQDTLDRVFEELCTKAVREAAEAGTWPAALWAALEEVGLTRALLPEAAGGSGIDFDDAMFALRRTAYHAAPLPLAETLLAGRLLAAAGLEVPEGALTLGPVTAGERVIFDAGTRAARVSATLARLPWGDVCAHAVLVGECEGRDMLALVAIADAGGAVQKNLAGEPRASLRLDRHPVVAAAPLEGARERLWLEGALARSVQMAGALERILAYALQYANERVQFGRPIAKFQAIQHMLAILAGQVAAASAAADAAVEASCTAADEFAICVAKARTGEAASKGTEIAHQVHGAMGYTREHNLHYSTRRLWSWRDEFGNESYWQTRLGRKVAADGPDALWPLLTRI